MSNRGELISQLEAARHELHKAQTLVAELEFQLTESSSAAAAQTVTSHENTSLSGNRLTDQPSDLLQTEQQLRLFIEHAPAAIAMLDTDMKYLLVSQRWLSDYRLDERDVIGLSHYEVFPDIPEQWKEIHQRCLQGAIEKSEADPFPRADGTLDWVRWEIRPWYKANGDIGGIFLFSEVITKRKQAQTAIEQYAQRMEILHQLDLGLLRGDSIPELVHVTFKRLQQIIPCQRANLMLFDAKTGDALIFAADMNGETALQEGTRLPIYPIAMEGLDDHYSRIINDLRPLQDASPNIAQVVKEGLLSAVRVVLMDQDRPIGSLGLLADKVDFFTAEHQEIAIEIANQLAIVLKQMRLSEELALHQQTLEGLVEQRTTELVTAKEQVEAILNNSPDAIFLVDTDLRIQQTNAAFNHLFRCQPDDYFEQSALKLIHPDYMDMVIRMAEAVITEQTGLYFEVKALRKDGTDFEAEFSAGLISGNGLVWSIRDITERKATERQLRYQASLQDNVSDAVIVTDMAFRIQSWNKAAERIYGWGVHEVVNKSVADILRTEFASSDERERSILQLREQGWWQGEVMQHHKDGSIRYIWGSVTLIKDENGVPFSIISVNHDITEHKRDEEVLRQSEERFASVFRFSPVAIAITTVAEGQYLDVNDSLLNLLGYTRDEMIGRTALDLNVWVTLEERDVVVQAIREQGSVRGLEARFRQKNGDICTTLTSIVPIMLDGQSCFLSIIQDITERKRTEQALYESEKRYRLLAENVTDVITVVDAQYIRTFVTSSCYALIGYTPDELIGQPGNHILHPDDLPTAQAIIFSAVESGNTTFRYELRIHHKAGHYVWIEGTGSIIRDAASGDLVEIITVIREITERKRAEESLRASEGRYRLLAENIADVIMTFSIDRVITYMSPSCERLLGYVPEEVEGKSHSEFIHPEDYPQVIAKTRQAVASKENYYTNQFRLRHKAGQYIWYEVRTRIVFDSHSGSVVQFISVLRDITERKHAENALRESEERFRSFFEQPLVGMAVTTPDKGVILVNDKLCEMFDYSREELLQLNWAEITHPDDLAADNKLFVQVLGGKIDGYSIDKRYIRKDGHIIDTIMTCRCLRDSQGKVLRFVALVQDISERKRTLAALNTKFREELEFQNYLKALHDITIELTDIDAPDAFYKRVIELGLERLGFDRLALFLYDDKDGSALGTYGTDPDGNLSDERLLRFIPDADGIMLRAFERSERLCFDDNTQLYHNEEVIGTGWHAATVLWNGTKSLGWLIADNLLTQSPASKPLLDILGLYAMTVGSLLAHKQAQIALHESEIKYRLLAENITDVIVKMSPDGIRTFITPSCYSLLGYTPDELIGRPGFEIVHPDDRQGSQSVLMKAINSSSSSFTLIQRVLHKKGHYIWVEVTTTLVRDTTTGIVQELMGVVRDVTERKHAEDALRESEERFRQIAENFDRVLYIASIDHQQMLYVNPHYEIMYGKSRQSLYANPDSFMAVVHPDDREYVRLQLVERRYIEDGFADFEYRTLREDGIIRWLRIHSFPIKAADGSMLRRAGFIEDITERKQITAELERQRIFLRNVIDASPSVIFVKDYDGRFVLGNKTLGHLHNMPVAALIGKTDAEINPRLDEVDHFVEVDRQVIDTGNPIFLEESATGADGEKHWFHTTKVQIISPDGQSKYVLGVATDITERKQAEVALRESEERFRMLVEAAPVAIIITNQTGQIVLVNEQAQHIFGYQRDEMVGQAVEMLMPENIHKRHIHHRKDYLDAPTIRPMGSGLELVARRKDNTLFPVEIELSYIKTSNNVLVMSFILDITARRQAENTLRQALQKERELGELKTRFVSMASHEFRTPLATILALTETLSAYRHKLSDEQIDQRLDKIQIQVAHLKDIMEDVLLLARMQARRVEFNPTDVDLDALCRSVLDEFESGITSQHRLVYDCEPNLPSLKLDRKLMRQIISNLVGNAIKYSPQRKPVHVTLEYADDALILQVKDEGIGIPKADLIHLFEPFHRADNVGTIPGTGLGLVITKEAVELHGGNITVESQLNIGTKFTIRIPLTTEGDNNHDENSAY